jgi:hypothetical protein
MRMQRKRVPVTLMAGSSFTRSLQKPPQIPPEPNKRTVPIPPQTVSNFLGLDRTAKKNPIAEFHKLFGSESLSQEKLLTIDDVAPVAMPKCPHGVRLTKDEYIFELSYKGRPFHKRINGKRYFLYPKSFECIECLPVCIHGMELTAKERDSRKRFSNRCPECTGEIKSARNLKTFLSKQHLTESWGMSLTEGEVVTSYGLRITKAGKNYVVAGGSKVMEFEDAKAEGHILESNIGFGPSSVYDSGCTDGMHEDDRAEIEFIESLENTVIEKSEKIGKTEPEPEPETDAE